jgi:hypothetical protein
LATGQASGIVVLDVDYDRDGFSTLAQVQEQHGNLPDTATVKTGGGGRHYYFHAAAPIPSRKDRWGDGVELKGDGTYVVLPGSVHPSGARYTWVRPQLAASPAACPTWIMECVAETAVGRCGAVAEAGAADVAAALSAEDVVRLTLPTDVGQRNGKLFDLARGLRFNAGMAAADRTAIVPHVRSWFGQALPVIATKDWTVTWEDFMAAWTKARHPLGADLLEQAAGLADAGELPAVAANYEGEQTRKLVGMCWHLARLNGGDAFFLSSHEAAKRLGLEPVQAWRLLDRLRKDGVVESVKAGNKRRATRYRWTGGTADVVGQDAGPGVDVVGELAARATA